MSTTQPSSPRQATGVVPPRSAGLATAVATLALLSLGVATGTLRFITVGVGIGVALAVGITAIDSTRTVRTLLGGLCLLGATAGAVLVPVALVVVSGTTPAGLCAGSIVVGLGLARFRLDAVGDGAVIRAIAWLLRVAFVLGAATIIVGAFRLNVTYVIDTAATVGPVGSLIAPTTPNGTATGFVVLTWLAFAGIWLVVSVLPPATVFDGDTRRRYQRARTAVVWGMGLVLGGGGLLLGILYVLSVQAGVASQTLGPVVSSLVGSEPLRILLVRLSLTSTVVGTLLLVVRSLGIVVLFEQPAWLASVVVVAGLCAIGSAAGARVVLDAVPFGQVATLTTALGASTVGLLAGVGGLLALCGGFAVLTGLSGAGILPARTAGPRLVIVGLLTVAVVAATSEMATPIVFGVIAAAVVTWDIADYGVGLTATIGATPARREGELAHGIASLAVGVLGLVVAVVVERVLAGVDPSGEGAVVTITLAAVAVGVLTLVRWR